MGWDSSSKVKAKESGHRKKRRGITSVNHFNDVSALH